MELLFGSAATAARNVRGEEYFNKMIEEAVKQKNLKSIVPKIRSAKQKLWRFAKKLLNVTIWI